MPKKKQVPKELAVDALYPAEELVKRAHRLAARNDYQIEKPDIEFIVYFLGARRFVHDGDFQESYGTPTDCLSILEESGIPPEAAAKLAFIFLRHPEAFVKLVANIIAETERIVGRPLWIVRRLIRCELAQGRSLRDEYILKYSALFGAKNVSKQMIRDALKEERRKPVSAPITPIVREKRRS